MRAGLEEARAYADRLIGKPDDTGHAERAHSKFSASGAERWFACPGSVDLSEGLPDKSSVWAEEGTRAHEVLEGFMLAAFKHGWRAVPVIAQNLVASRGVPREMIRHGVHAANFMLNRAAAIPGSDLLVESRIYLSFIHPEMFGTYDGAIVDYFGTLDVFDYKYGQGHVVSPVKNLQMIFYAIGVAHLHHWNFKRVRVWIIQPRIKGYDGPVFWEISTEELRAYIPLFAAAVARAEAEPGTFIEGSHCHWCKAKAICPLKAQAKLENAKSVFSIVPYRKEVHGQEIEKARSPFPPLPRKARKEKITFQGCNHDSDGDQGSD